MLTRQALPCKYCECGTQIYTYFRAVGSYFLNPKPYYKHGTSVFGIFANFVMYQEWPVIF